MTKWGEGKSTARAQAMPAFEPPQGSASANLAAFIAQAALVAARKGIDLEKDEWEVSKMTPRSGLNIRPGRINLCFAEGRGGGRIGEPVPPCIREFAKAYCVHFVGNMQFTGLKDRQDAMMYLGVALGDNPVESITIHVLDSAMAALKAHYTPDAARNRGVQLELIAEFLDESGIVAADLSGWSHGCPSPTPKGRGRGSASASSAKVLPTPAFQGAITTSFARAVRPHHVLISGGCTIMRCVPSRVGQIMRLEEDSATTFEEDGQRRLRLLVPGAKGGPPTSRLVDKDMTPVVRLGFSRMLKATAEPRAMKRHYRELPKTLYLPLELEHLRDRNLTRGEASLLLGIHPNYFVDYASEHDIDFPRNVDSVRFDVVAQHILSQLDELEDAAGRDCNPLMLIKWKSLRTQGSPCMFEPLKYATFRQALKPSHGNIGMFPQLGVDRPEEATGVTHSLRRDLITTGIRNGLGQDDLFQWGGAADARWIPTYDYTTDADFRDPATGVAAVLLEGIAEDLGTVGEGDCDDE